MKMSEKLYRWQRTQSAWAEQKATETYLKTAPLPKDDPGLHKTVRCRVTGNFCISGKPAPIGETISLPWYMAQDLKARGKVLIIE